MQKIVLTEQGLRLSNEIFSHSDSSLPPFVEDAKPPSKAKKQIKLDHLLNVSNGFIDRNTLKTAGSNRNQSKPFFLPELEFNSNTHKQTGHQFASKVSHKSFENNKMKQNVSASKNMDSLNQNNQINFERPLVLDSNDFANYQVHPKESTQKRGSFMKRPSQFPTYLPTEESLDNQHKSTFFIPSSQKFLKTQEQLNSENKLKFQTYMQSVFQQSPSNTEKVNQQNNIKASQNVLLKNSQSDKYIENIKNRMEMKKDGFIKKRQIQEKKLKELSNIRNNLSNDPVHIAAHFLKDLKQLNQTVDNYIIDAGFQKQRYKDRLKEFHHHKYQKMWSTMIFPRKRSHTPKKVQVEFDDLDDYKPLNIQNNVNNKKIISKTSQTIKPAN